MLVELIDEVVDDGLLARDLVGDAAHKGQFQRLFVRGDFGQADPRGIDHVSQGSVAYFEAKHVAGRAGERSGRSDFLAVVTNKGMQNRKFYLKKIVISTLHRRFDNEVGSVRWIFQHLEILLPLAINLL